jgi:D-alanyl-D-alanine carboxypeptidase/D-alanyl-D-alanine-endopeptidase (penicillin-binding protein 4)
MADLKFIFIICILLFISSCTPHENSDKSSNVSKPKIITNFINQPSLKNASIGILATDLNSGEIVLAHNSKLSLVPASTLKILTSMAALETFGPDYKFKTTLAYTGNISESRTLNGDLILLGGGDPTFLSSRFEKHYKNAMTDMVQESQNSGIRYINGNIVADGSYFGLPQIPDTWIWEDIGNYYGSPAFGLNILDNTYTITFKTGKAGSLSGIININPELPWINFENRVMAAKNNSDNAYIYGSYLSDKRLINGTIPENRNTFSIKGATPDPALLAAHQLLYGLKEKGIGISGETVSDYAKKQQAKRQTLLVINSPPLSEIIEQLNMRSINLYAETLLLHLAKKSTEDCSVEAGCESLKTFWKDAGMDVSGLNLEDGSGLSRANAITAEQLVFVLQHMHQSNNKETFLQSLPVAGKSGTLKSFAPNTVLEGNLKAKSGYMARAMNYTGYLTTESGKEIAIAVMVNNYNCSNTEMRNMLEKFLVSLVKNP